MAEAFLRTMKRDYVRVAEKPNARAVINQLPSWFHHQKTPSTRIAPLAASTPANTSSNQPERNCPRIKGQRHRSPRPEQGTLPEVPRSLGKANIDAVNRTQVEVHPKIREIQGTYLLQELTINN